eukprot:438299-Alexandrium_andersonii.AAC.1
MPRGGRHGGVALRHRQAPQAALPDRCRLRRAACLESATRWLKSSSAEGPCHCPCAEPASEG